MILDEFNLKGQVAIVTGAGSPRGKAIVAALAEAGADVVEANFSCPNVHGLEGRLFARPEEAAQVARCIREEVGKFNKLAVINLISLLLPLVQAGFLELDLASQPQNINICPNRLGIQFSR